MPEFQTNGGTIQVHACALMAPNLLFYLGPDDPDPDSEQLNRPVRQPAAGATTGSV
jgi:hypothetical protein